MRRGYVCVLFVYGSDYENGDISAKCKWKTCGPQIVVIALGTLTFYLDIEMLVERSVQCIQILPSSSNVSE